MPIKGKLYTTKEAAALLGLSHGTIRNAVQRGVIQAEVVTPRLNLIPEREIERYRRDHLGGKGWATSRRAAPPTGTQPDADELTGAEAAGNDEQAIGESPL